MTPFAAFTLANLLAWLALWRWDDDGHCGCCDYTTGRPLGASGGRWWW